MPPVEPTDEEKKEQLAQDGQTPFQPAAPAPDPSGGVVNDPVTQASSDDTLDDTHPATDTGMQPEEQYDEGVAGAAEAQEPNAGTAVVDAAPGAQPTPPAPSSPAPTDEPGDDVPPPSSGDVVVG